MSLKSTGAPRDHRRGAIIAAFLLIAGFGAIVRLVPGNGIVAGDPGRAFDGLRMPLTPARDSGRKTEEVTPNEQDEKSKGELGRALKLAEERLNAGDHNTAIRILNKIRPLAGNSAQAYRLIGRALAGRGDNQTARDFLAKAIDLDPTLAETYFDYATVSENLGDLESALGGMRNFLHLETKNDPYRLKIAQARSAIWEWESQLGRGPWGPTKGIPPGFTAEMIKRDGKGVGVMMQKPETLRPDGTMDFEIKSGRRFPELWSK